MRALSFMVIDSSGTTSVTVPVIIGEAVRAGGSRVFGGGWDPLKRVPRGYPADHPRAEVLRWKGVEISHRPGLPDWLGRPEASSRIDDLVETGRPLHDWLGRYVGASELTAEERFAPRRPPATGS